MNNARVSNDGMRISAASINLAKAKKAGRMLNVYIPRTNAEIVARKRRGLLPDEDNELEDDSDEPKQPYNPTKEEVKGGYWKDIDFNTNIWDSEFGEGNLFSSISLSTTHLSSIINLIEENNNNNAKLKLIGYVNIAHSNSENNDRKKLRVLNILDMNIVPFDVHSLMKEVPFANLINYSYTFDRLVTDIVLPQWFRYKASDAIKSSIITDKDVKSLEECLLMTVIDPNINFNDENFRNFVEMLKGGKKLNKLNHPAYINDQLHDKVLQHMKDDIFVNRSLTKLFRNLLWFAQLQRLMKVSMTSYLSYVDAPVVTGLDIADPIITEYNEGQKYDERVFQGIRDNLL